MIGVEGLNNGNFKKDRDGNTVFFPWGVFGKGRVLPDEPTATKVRAFVSGYNKVSLLVIMIFPFVVTNGWMIWSFLLAFILGAFFYFGSKSLISDCPYSEDRLTFKEVWAKPATNHNKLILWFSFIFCLLFALGGIFIAGTANSFVQTMSGLFYVVFFGACGTAIGYMLKLKRT